MSQDNDPRAERTIIEEPAIIRREVVHTREGGATGWWIATLVAVVAVMGLIFMYANRPSQADLNAATEAGRAQAATEAATAQAQSAATAATQASANAAASMSQATQAAAASAKSAADETAAAADAATTNASAQLDRSAPQGQH